MGRVTYLVTAVLFLVIYLSISLYFINRALSYKGHLFNPIMGVFKNSRHNELLLHLVPENTDKLKEKDFMTKLRNMLEEENYSASGFEAVDGLVERTKRTRSDMLGHTVSFRTLKGVGPGLEKEPGICESLVSGIDKTRWKAVKKVKSSQKKLGHRVYTDKNLTNVFNSCEKISSFIRSSISSDIENEKPIAYSILLNRPADQTFQLLRAIYHPANVYCLHVHTDATKRYFALIRKLVDCVDNFRMADGRHRLAYATYERVEAHLSCHRVLLNTTIAWRYLISIPGSVFPLRNNTFVADYLEKRHYLNSITYSDSSHKSFLRRTNFVHRMTEHSGGYKIFARTKKRKDPPPYNMTLFRSDSSFIATRGFIDFVATSNISKELLLWAKDTRSPDEFFWATLDRLPGTPGGTPYRKDSFDIDSTLPDEDILYSNENDLVVKLWKSQKTPKCGGKYSSNLCIFNYKDLRWLLGQDSLFADAFDMKVDNVAIGCLHKNLKRPLVEDYYPNKIVNFT